VILFQIIWGNILLGFFALGFLGWTFAALGNLVYLAFFLYWLFLMYKAYSNETYKIPVIGEWASKQAAK